MPTRQPFGPGSPLSIAPDADSIGVVSLVDLGGKIYGITAEHVVGLGNLNASLFSYGRIVGRVSKCGYALANLDAVLFELESVQSATTTVAGRELLAPRAPRQSDLGDPELTRPAHVYHPHTNMLEAVEIHYIHASGFELVCPDGTPFTPRPLTLTDLCTKSGESGTLLLSSDWRPIGLLSGIVETSDGRGYSCFTELAAVMDVLMA